MKIVFKKPEEIVNFVSNGQRCKDFVILKIRFYHKNHYETLGIKPSATQAEIKAAYVRLSKKLHPDMNRKDPKSHDKFVAVNNAYGVLCKPGTRRQYDIESGIVHRSMPRVRVHQRKTKYTSYDKTVYRYGSYKHNSWHFHNRNSFSYKNPHVQDRVYTIPFIAPLLVLTIVAISYEWLMGIQKTIREQKQDSEDVP